MRIADYLIREELYQGKHFFVYRAIKEKDTLLRILKVLHKKAAPPSIVMNAIKREYSFLRQINSQFVMKAVDWIDDKDYAVIVLEDVNGRTLEQEIKEKPLSVEQFMRLAIGISSGLAAIHEQNIIHKDINPTNIIWNSKTGSMKIFDFNIASKFDVKVSYLGNPEQLQGTLPYISPEQTGRMNRRVDQRSDIYSLGVTFYQMLTGQLPFRRQNPIEIVYDHLARDPEPPHLVNAQIPLLLSKIILKMLAKNPEERYQSVEGVKHDLEKFHKPGVPDFKLGEKDFSGKLQIPEKLYGREKEIKQLLEIYQEVSKGATGLILVRGYSGTGKSALVNEIHKPITRDRGYFISGKFDQLQRTIPYFAFIQALNRFCQILLTEKQEILTRWKERILQRVGKLGKVLTDTIPQLESVIGKQPDVPEVGGEEAKKRFNHAFQCFLQAVSGQEHPLVIFIDDLQWADLASLNLLQVLIEDRQNRCLLFIGAYRDNEVSPTHPLTTTLEEIQKQDIPLHTIPVKNLSRQNVREWLRDTLKISSDTSVKDADSLSDLIYQKTQGNAFFTIQFLESLYQENLLRFDFNQSRWKWDMKEIEKLNITDNVVDLLVRKIQILPTGVKDVLKLAACIGNVFDLHTLSVISQNEKEEQEKHLEISLIEHLIYPLDNDVYKFVHDRIHQATYSLISAEDKKPLHLKIGRLLLKNLEASKTADSESVSKETERQIFNIVNHLNIGIDLIKKEKERVQLARLNLEAGHNARMSAAYKTAAIYVHTAIGLLPTDCWQHYDLTLSVYNEAVQTSYLCGNFAEMESFIETVLTFAHNITDTSVAHEHRMRGLMAQNQPQRAVETLLTIFSNLGVNIPRKPGKLQTRWILLKTHALLRRKGVESLTDLPPMNDPGKQLVIKLFYMGGSALAYAAPGVMSYIIGKMIGFILTDGLPPESPYVLSVYGGKRVFLGDAPGAYLLAEIIMDLLDRRIGNEAIKVRALTIICVSILGNKQHFKKVCKLLMDTYQYALNVGNIEYAGYILVNYLLFLSRTDTEIAVLHKKAQNIQDKAIQLKQSIILTPILVDMSVSSNLLGKHSNPAFLDLDLNSLFQNLQEDTKRVFICQANIKRIVLAYLFDEYSYILEYIKAVEETWKHITSPLTFMESDIYFYIPLAYLQLYTGSAAKNDKKKYLRKAKKSIEIMKKSAEFGPVNFLHKYYLLQAELYRVTGKSKQAAEYYEKAVEKAYENEYINEAAVANELAAKFYKQNNQHKIAALYFMEARDGYRKWGAVAKVKHLEENYPKYLSMRIPGSPIDTGTVSLLANESSGEFLDVKSILKASHTLSGEVQLKSLLEKMMQILRENAGAQRGVLITNTAERLLIQAEGNTDGTSEILQALPIEESETIPLPVINYVARSKQQLVFDNISNDTNYSTDDYIRTHQPKSVVCFPVLSKGKLSAIIYLENNLVEGAFTPSRLEVLNMLSAQIAISVENAELYENLEQKVAQRTRELREKSEQILDSIRYSKRIQTAIMPLEEKLKTALPEHFILFLPRDIVSGDFYWYTEIDNCIIFAVVDCTGHGVPGSLLAMMGDIFLKEIVNTERVFEPARILEELHKKVRTHLRQEEDKAETMDGMDVCLCRIEKGKGKLYFAGAGRSLYIVKATKATRGKITPSFVKIRGDRKSIGGRQKETTRKYTTHEIDTKKGDMIYLTSDGFADQPDPNMKKYGSKRLKAFLTTLAPLPAEKQKLCLEEELKTHQETERQRDDITIVGIRL